MELEKKSNGSLVGLVVIVIILIIGGIYIWMSNKNDVEKTIQSDTLTSQDSAELNSLDADLETTDTSTGLDANAINAIN